MIRQDKTHSAWTALLLSFLPPHCLVSFKVLLIILFIHSKKISHFGTKLESNWERDASLLPSPLYG